MPFDWLEKFRKKKHWPALPIDLLRKRARLLVIDDQDFPYLSLFKRDGYAIDKWNDVDDLQKLTDGNFDVILLDVQGVGRQLSKDQGLGVLRHLRKEAPAQIVIAYSSAEFSLKYQDFFREANASLEKGADYVDFKSVVDEQLRQHFSLQFYVESIVKVVNPAAEERAKLGAIAQNAILGRDVSALERYVGRGSVLPKEAIKTVALIAKTAIHVYSALAS